MLRRVTMAVVIELPEQQMKALEPYQDRLDEVIFAGIAKVRLTDALRMYEKCEVSLGRAVEIAGVTRQEFISEAQRAGVKPTTYPGMAAEELA
jgi:hypothetical protein